VVVPVSPDVIARRRGPAKKKDNAEDARIACLIALDRFERLRPLLPHGEIAGELRAIARDDERAARGERRLLNRLRQDLIATFPAALEVGGEDLGAPTFLRMLERWPTGNALAGASRAELVAFARSCKHGWPERFAAGAGPRGASTLKERGMGKLRILLLATGILAPSLGCSRQAAPNADTSRDILLFLSHYGKFSPAEAKEIARQMERGPHDLAVQLAAARREGILLKVTALQPALPSPERNAAPIYTRLMHLLKAKHLDPATDKVRGSLGVRVTHSPKEVAAVRRVLSERKDVMRLVHEAANKPACIFRRDWTRGILMVYPENATMREAARLLSAESYFLTQEGRYREAVANQARIFRVAQHPTSDPVAISQLVGMACDSIALAGFENILSVVGPNPEVAEAVRTTVATRRPRFRLRRTLEGEIATYSTGMNGLRRGSPAKDEAH